MASLVEAGVSGPGYKLNTDGSRRSNTAAGGGVIRGARGDFVLGFVVKYAHDDVVQAKLDSMLNGLWICTYRNINMVEVEVDSRVAFNLIMQKPATNWRYTYTVRKLLTRVQGCSCIFREQNKVADGFAKLGLNADTELEFTSVVEVPRHILKLLFFYRICFPAFRPRCN